MTKRKDNSKGLILGIDVGSVSISAVCIDTDGNLIKEDYVLHHGDIRMALEAIFKTYNALDIAGIASPSGKALFQRIMFLFSISRFPLWKGSLSWG